MLRFFDFLDEVINRVQAKTPVFFRTLQKVSAALAAVSGVLISQNIAVPDWLEWLTSTITLTIAIMGAVLPQLAVAEPDKVSLPYTEPEKLP